MPKQDNPTAEGGTSRTGGGLGCALVMLGINGLLIGPIAFSFSRGSYSSFEQEVWYRYGSIIFLLAGVILPGMIIATGALRHPRMVISSVAWMMVILAVFVVYVFGSGGGI